MGRGARDHRQTDRRPDNTRHRVLDAARTLFADQGYRATSMRQIAERVGITKPALYYHFPGKEDILAELTEPLLDELETSLAEAETHTDPDAVRWRAIEGLLDVYLRHRKTLLMLVRDMTLLVQAPVAERFRAAAKLANDLVAGNDRSPWQLVRTAQVVASLGDPVIAHADMPEPLLREFVLDGVRALLGEAPATRPDARESAGTERPARPTRARGRAGGRPAALTAEQATRVRIMYQSGTVSVDEIAARLGVSRATVYRCLKTLNSET